MTDGDYSNSRRFRFSTDDHPPEHRVALWCDRMREHGYPSTPVLAAGASTFSARLEGLAAGRFRTLHVLANHQEARRTAAHVAGLTDDTFTICRFGVSASWDTRLGGASVAMPFGRGDWIITSSNWEFRAVGTEADWEILIIPQSALSPLLTGGRLTHPIKLAADSPLGALLSTSFDAGKAQIPLLSPALGEAALQALCHLVAVACQTMAEPPSTAGRARRDELLSVAKRYIEQHLANPDLTAASTAAALGISVRLLYSVFEPTGAGFARYVSRQRLLMCRDTIAGATGTARSVTDIALGWGFNSMATFYRAYASEFGTAPSALRRAPAGA